MGIPAAEGQRRLSGRVGNRQTPYLTGQMTHDLALTLNVVATRRKKEMAEAIARLVGLGGDQLSTAEASLCLDILLRPQEPA